MQVLVAAGKKFPEKVPFLPHPEQIPVPPQTPFRAASRNGNINSRDFPRK
jgi:hypothetical protein